jgi:two-component system, cell cycle sensor histidine kinase and response regulator CckA
MSPNVPNPNQPDDVFSSRSPSALSGQTPDVKAKSGAGRLKNSRKTPREDGRSPCELSTEILDSIPDSVWMKDRDGVFLMVNQAWAQSIGTTAQQTIGYPDVEVFPGELGQQLREQDQLVMQSGKPKQIEEYFNVNGHLVWTDTILTPISDKTGAPVGIIGIARNITQRKQLEERFLRTQRMESLGALASGIAHDLHNILGPILMSASILEESVKDPNDRELVTIVREAAQRGADIVKQVLTFARGTQSEHEPLEPRLLIDQVKRILLKVMPKSVTFSINLSDNLSNITGDATQLHQVFMNLCMNARDAMPHGGVLTITGGNVEVDQAMAMHHGYARPGPYVCLAVADTGVGIPEAIREKIFEPFFTTKEPGKGTGLGLSTALAILKNHNSFVTLTSEVSKGSTFSVYIPAAECPKPPAAPAPVSPAPLPQGHGETILVVDDEQPICKMVETILSQKDYLVLSAHNGPEALRLFSEKRSEIRAVLTDLAMPGMTGTELIKALKTIDPGLPIIASTGQSSEQRYKELAALNIPLRLSKPYSARQLLSMISEAVNQRGAA